MGAGRQCGCVHQSIPGVIHGSLYVFGLSRWETWRPAPQSGLNRRRIVAITTASSRDDAVPSRWWPSPCWGMPTTDSSAASIVCRPPASNTGSASSCRPRLSQRSRVMPRSIRTFEAHVVAPSTGDGRATPPRSDAPGGHGKAGAGCPERSSFWAPIWGSDPVPIDTVGITGAAAGGRSGGGVGAGGGGQAGSGGGAADRGRGGWTALGRGQSARAGAGRQGRPGRPGQAGQRDGLGDGQTEAANLTRLLAGFQPKPRCPLQTCGAPIWNDSLRSASTSLDLALMGWLLAMPTSAAQSSLAPRSPAHIWSWPV